MTSRLRRPARTTAVLLISALTLVGASAAVPAGAVPVDSAYTCTSPSLNGNKLNIKFAIDVTAPAKMYVGKTHTPNLVLKATIPGNIVGLAAIFGVKSASATGNLTVKINGQASPRPFVFPRTDIPQAAQDFPVTITTTLPKLAPTAVGSTTYKPGPISITLEGFNKKVADAQDGDSVGTVDAGCTSDSPNQVLRTVTYVRSATSTTGALASIPGKKVRATAVVTSRSGVAPTGTVTAKVYRGKKLLVTRTARLGNRSAAAVFPKPARKGTYKVVLTYSGSKALVGSSTSRTFRIR